MLHAPINLFFDLVPIGQIMQIFNENVDYLAYGRILEPVKKVLDMASTIFVTVALMVSIGGSWEVFLGLALMLWCMAYASKPWLSADNKLQKNGNYLGGRLHSYFYECMRGT